MIRVHKPGVVHTPPGVRHVPFRKLLQPGVPPGQQRHRMFTSVPCRALQLDNRELLVGDVISLVSFSLWKQITAIIFLPTFPGWLAPLAFNPIRFVEFGAFAATLVGTWVACATLVGAYKMEASSGMREAAVCCCASGLLCKPHVHDRPANRAPLCHCRVAGQPTCGSGRACAADCSRGGHACGRRRVCFCAPACCFRAW